ncbi:hypothetical protein VSVS12_03649 [Vibrio scophthalmi]|uniref:hypothetical protein n=1 Tax=Vibrio scophthalmi TaxID=45658 RepID=UPI0008096F58|nr:hypothetical protein [Vibrio scophthalmi]ANS87350.1 hypothetical protein VSVS12_03649 [Vibrio scophthalmi]
MCIYLKFMIFIKIIRGFLRARHGKHEFTFDSVYFNSLKEGGFLSVNEAFVAVFSPEIKTHLKLKELKLRPSNLLLIGIFILHANELGFVLSPMTKDDEWLTESKMRRLMGGINQSRLKSQLATLRSIGFIKSEAGGGVSPIYFGKFGKRYQIDSDFLFLLKNEKNAVFIDERISNFSDLIYETPECYLACHTVKDCTLKYEFDFELPFKLSFLLRKKINLHERLRTIEYKQMPKKEIVDNFDLSRLELAPFFRRNILTLGILAKLEILTSLILINHWQALTRETFEQLDQLIESDTEIQQVVQKNSIFTQKYLNERKNVELLDEMYCFWKNSLLSLSSGLAMSLAKVIRGHCGKNAELKTVSMLIHDFQHYALRNPLMILIKIINLR